ncbi:PEPxxWA-CTERM sorting domain-containing protein [Sphingomonas trueperi]|uniref:PEPxxWA-CTERM sorting domain-containing protein n=1 Tax=Sphingomonas trueperi TaxID=53317 RepID=UPI0033930F82
MDAIGWNVNVNVLANGGYKFTTRDVVQAWAAAGGAVPAPVPEPANWVMLMLGFGVIGAAMRYRNQTQRVRFA